jgi:4-carboxymuconolactone decarboxylase
MGGDSVLRILAFAVALVGAASIQEANAAERPTAPSAPAWPSDIDPRSGFRLPLPRREDLDEYGQKTFDRGATPGANIAGLQGPAGIQLHSPWATHQLSILSKYLRDDAGFSPRVREIAFLTTSREMDNQFEWTAHEPVALKVGVPATVVDVIKYKKSTEGLEEADAVIINLGRQIWSDHKVAPETFARAHALFGSRMLVDLVLLMGHHATIAALLATVDMQLHAGREPLLPEL